MLVLEQFINTLPADVRVWVQEHKPKTSEVAAQLADDYLQARKSSSVRREENKTNNSDPDRVCQVQEKGAQGQRLSREPGQQTERTRRDLKDITCFTCNQKGHYLANCPSKTNLLCVERRSNFQGDSELIEREVSSKPGVFQEGGQPVSDVCLDTGCTRTMVRQDLVLIEGDSIAICCAHRGTQ